MLELDEDCEENLETGAPQTESLHGKKSKGYGEEGSQKTAPSANKEPKGKSKAEPAETVASQTTPPATENVGSNVAGGLKVVVDCATECAQNCTQGKNYTVIEMIKCLQGCKCDKKATEQLLQSTDSFI